MQQKIQLKLKNILESFLTGQFADTTAVFETINKVMAKSALSEKDMSQFSKFMSIFFIGQLVDLPTLNRIINYCGIKSKNAQKKIKKYSIY